MRKLLLITISVLMLFSCSSEIDIPSNVKVKWRFKLNGVEYRWSGNYLSLDTDGACIVADQGNITQISGFNCNGSCSGTGAFRVNFILALPINFKTGKYVLNQGTIQNLNYSGTIIINENSMYQSSSQGGDLTVNIIETSNRVNGIVKGTFSGTVINVNNLSRNVISDGYFEAIRPI